MFNFGDGAVAALLAKDAPNALLGCYAVTDGSFSLQVKVDRGGSVADRRRPRTSTSPTRRR